MAKPKAEASDLVDHKAEAVCGVVLVRAKRTLQSAGRLQIPRRAVRVSSAKLPALVQRILVEPQQTVIHLNAKSTAVSRPKSHIAAETETAPVAKKPRACFLAEGTGVFRSKPKSNRCRPPGDPTADISFFLGLQDPEREPRRVTCADANHEGISTPPAHSRRSPCLKGWPERKGAGMGPPGSGVDDAFSQDSSDDLDVESAEFPEAEEMHLQLPERHMKLLGTLNDDHHQLLPVSSG